MKPQCRSIQRCLSDYKDYLPDLRRTADLANNPHLDAERKERQRWVTEAVNRLPIKHRTVVILHEFEGLTHAEIASILNCSEGTVRSRLHYARQKLRDLLKPYMDSTDFPLTKSD